MSEVPVHETQPDALSRICSHLPSSWNTGSRERLFDFQVLDVKKRPGRPNHLRPYSLVYVFRDSRDESSGSRFRAVISLKIPLL